jgi:hypothetical protein
MWCERSLTLCTTLVHRGVHQCGACTILVHRGVHQCGACTILVHGGVVYKSHTPFGSCRESRPRGPHKAQVCIIFKFFCKIAKHIRVYPKYVLGLLGKPYFLNKNHYHYDLYKSMTCKVGPRVARVASPFYYFLKFFKKKRKRGV